MFRKFILSLALLSFLLSGCIFRKPIEVKKEYYASGNLKTVRKIYKHGEKVKYYTDGAVHDTPKAKKKK